MYQSNIDQKTLKNLPLGRFEGSIHMIDSLSMLDRYIPVLMKEPVLGFDTETRPTFKKGRQNPISLVQLATPFHACLFRINSLGLPGALTRLFENGDILKVGAAVQDDLLDLQKIRPFSPAGFLDLQKYVEAFGIESKGLNKLAGIVLGFRISKAKQVSNWEAFPLSDAQKRYAATDAWICLQIYRELKRR